MPIIKSAKKRVRQSEKRRIRNKALRTYMKNLKKKTLEILTSEEVGEKEALEALKLYKSKVDKAWTKGLYKRNKSSRLKSAADQIFYQRFVAPQKKEENDG